jgi:hypothetical protein
MCSTRRLGALCAAYRAGLTPIRIGSGRFACRSMENSDMAEATPIKEPHDVRFTDRIVRLPACSSTRDRNRCAEAIRWHARQTEAAKPSAAPLDVMKW